VVERLAVVGIGAAREQQTGQLRIVSAARRAVERGHAPVLVYEEAVRERAAVEQLARERGAGERERWAAELALHFDAAGMWAQSLAYARETADRAARLYAPRAAVEHYTRAITAARECAPLDLGSLYLARGQMHELLGDFERARGDFAAADDDDAAGRLHEAADETQNGRFAAS